MWLCPRLDYMSRTVTHATSLEVFKGTFSRGLVRLRAGVVWYENPRSKSSALLDILNLACDPLQRETTWVSPAGSEKPSSPAWPVGPGAELGHKGCFLGCLPPSRPAGSGPFLPPPKGLYPGRLVPPQTSTQMFSSQEAFFEHQQPPATWARGSLFSASFAPFARCPTVSCP